MATSNTIDAYDTSNKYKEAYDKSFKEYIDQRYKSKKLLYTNVSLIGLIISVIGVLCYAIIFYLAKEFSKIFDIFLILSTILRVMGICFFSIVPIDDLDIIQVISDKDNRNICLAWFYSFLIFGFISGICMTISNSLYRQIDSIPYFIVSMGALYFIISDSFSYNEILLFFQIVIFVIAYEMSPVELAFETKSRIEIGSVCVVMLWIFVRLYLSLRKYFEYKNIPNLEKIKMEYNISQQKKEYNISQQKKEYNISQLYDLIYELCFIFSLTCFINGIYYIKEKTNGNAIWFITGIFDILPIILVKIYGPKYCFTLLARIFEYRVDQQQKDGAYMAALISKCQILPIEKGLDEVSREVLWIKRLDVKCKFIEDLQKLDDSHGKQSDCISRKFWIKTIVLKKINERFLLHVDYKEDIDLSVSFKYKKTDLIKENLSSLSSCSDITFEDWKLFYEENEYCSEIKIDYEKKIINFWYTIVDTEENPNSRITVTVDEEPSNNNNNNNNNNNSSVETEMMTLNPMIKMKTARIVTKEAARIENLTKEEKQEEEKLDKEKTEKQILDEIYETRKEMLDWGKVNIRRVQSNNLNRDGKVDKRVFTVSPRDLSSSDKWDYKKDDKDFFTDLKNFKPVEKLLEFLKYEKLNDDNKFKVEVINALEEKLKKFNDKSMDKKQKSYFNNINIFSSSGKSDSEKLRNTKTTKVSIRSTNTEEMMSNEPIKSDDDDDDNSNNNSNDNNNNNSNDDESKVAENTAITDAIKDIKINWRMKKLLSFSEVKEVNSRIDMIDMFCSHSWNDDGEKKCHALDCIIETFKIKKFRNPTFWIDKLCIDQKNTTKGIQHLPLFIGACKKILILMGNTYMTRLWCVWEIFILFTFCNKELGLERISLICIDDNIDVATAIEEFNIDNAHSFDPNEEYKLRYIMLKVIGEDTVRDSFHDMVNLVKIGKVHIMEKNDSNNKYILKKAAISANRIPENQKEKDEKDSLHSRDTRDSANKV